MTDQQLHSSDECSSYKQLDEYNSNEYFTNYQVSIDTDDDTMYSNHNETTESLLKSNNNIIKNIIKQYYKYLTNKQNSQLITEFIFKKSIQQSLKLINKYFKNIHYNNSSLVKILTHNKYGKGFEYYLTFDAVDLLHQSKVQDIQKHIRIIEHLKNCCVNHSLVNEIQYYNKKVNIRI